MTGPAAAERAELRRAFAAAVGDLLAGAERRELATGARTLSDRYRFGDRGPQVRTAEEALAYAAGRLPDTHAALLAVLGWWLEARPAAAVRSVLDVGAGPGTAAWAAVGMIESVEAVTLLEEQRGMIGLGKRLSALAARRAITDASWVRGSAIDADGVEPHDLVVAAYVLGELPAASQGTAVARWWELASDTLVIVEPGTPGGYGLIRDARARLIAAGGSVVAPCPHQLACPASEDNWCHFRQRLDRSSVQRMAKAGIRNYEDEKFSYVAVTRDTSPSEGSRGARVLRSRHGGGRVRLRVCDVDGAMRDLIVPKRDRDLYARARRSDWGDTLDVGTDA